MMGWVRYLNFRVTIRSIILHSSRLPQISFHAILYPFQNLDKYSLVLGTRTCSVRMQRNNGCRHSFFYYIIITLIHWPRPTHVMMFYLAGGTNTVSVVRADKWQYSHCCSRKGMLVLWLPERIERFHHCLYVFVFLKYDDNEAVMNDLIASPIVAMDKIDG